ncbi:MAG: efflux RND transporter periplasmic adaptor subunit [Gammaproteobacteria bacterium]|nr:efflux RND transporter periplasmic adaptor subunit [Gammaproteobacteria bacterium]
MTQHHATYRLAGLLVLFAISSLLSGCGEEEKGKRRNQGHIVETMKVSIAPQGEVIERIASLKAGQQVKVINEEAGRVLNLLAYEGERIQQAQPLVQMDDGLLRAELDKARARRKQAEAELTRQQQLRTKQLVSEEAYSRSLTEAEVTRADERLLQKRIDYMRLRAPIDGVISQRMVEQGDVLQRYSHAYTILDDRQLKARVSVSELLLPRIHTGVDVQIQLISTGQQQQARIARIFPAIDERTQQGTIEVVLDNTRGIRPGQLARIYIQLGQAIHPVIPVSALRQDARGSFVFVMDNQGKAKRQNIQAGRYYDDQVSIVSGLNVDDTVVIKGFLGLRSGKKVKAVSSDDS